MSFPKKGKFFPDRNGCLIDEPSTEGNFASEIAAALHRALGSTHAGVKTAAGWTGANERTVKNWFSGRYGPSGEHLVALAHHSDEIMNTFVRMAGRQDLIVAVKLAIAEDAIADLLLAIRSMNGGRT